MSTKAMKQSKPVEEYPGVVAVTYTQDEHSGLISNTGVANNVPRSLHKSIPTPVGYRLLVKVKPIEKQTKGGIHLTDATIGNAEVICNIGQVVAQGPLCYQHSKFLGERWCEVGDWVIFATYAGTVVLIKEAGDQQVRYRLMNDDDIVAVIADPDVVSSTAF